MPSTVTLLFAVVSSYVQSYPSDSSAFLACSFLSIYFVVPTFRKAGLKNELPIQTARLSWGADLLNLSNVVSVVKTMRYTVDGQCIQHAW